MPVSLSSRIGLDLGSWKTVMIRGGRKMPFHEPTLLAVDGGRSRVEYWGREARERLGKLPSGLEFIRPIRRGTIADYAAVLFFLKKAFARAMPPPRVFKPVVVASVPIHLTSVAVRALGDAVREAGGGHLYLIPCNIASSIHVLAGGDSPAGFMVMDFGAGTTDVSVIASGEIVIGRTVALGGEDLNAVIRRLLEVSFGLRVGEGEAEELKRRAGVAAHASDEMYVKRKADTASAGVFTEVKAPLEAVSSNLRRALQPVLDAVFGVLEETPPELFEDIMRKGLYLTGGSAKMPGLVEFLEEKTKLKVTVPSNPELTPILGIGRILLSDGGFRRQRERMTVVP
ncbi:MAG: rod shape-determining protein [bacterium]